ncbi:uncharacterized protein LOC131258451 isoform X2 [Anopheles coustani]|nr:uncharacterized protein LOC131258451 isoform X2 [Anopheles coustani]XP_058115758.1 uncharacterized protein LOC131258451 isoform X2 [Anopheles coustani]
MSKENTLHLISLVKSFGCLWNEKDPDFENDLKKTEAWEIISQAMDRPTHKLKHKWDSMRNCFVMCHAKHLSNIIKHKWFAYSALQFLDSKLANDMLQQNQHTIEETDVEIIDELVKSITKDCSLQLINLIKKYECLWNKKRPEYKNLCIRNDAWKEISYTMGYAPNVLRAKWQKLRNFHRSFTHRLEKKLKDGVTPLKRPSWYGFDAMGFLANSYESPPKWIIFLSDNYNYSDSETEEDNQLEPEQMSTANVGDCSPSPKSADKPTVEKLTTVTSQIETKPQSHLDVPIFNVKHSPPRVQTFLRSKRSVQDPLRIVRKVPPQLGQTVTSVTNQPSIKSFLNLLEHELNALSEDYATMAQVEIYRIVGEFKLKDVSRRQARIQVQKLHVDKPQPVRILTVQKIQAQPDIPIEITPDLPTEIKSEPPS